MHGGDQWTAVGDDERESHRLRPGEYEQDPPPEVECAVPRHHDSDDKTTGGDDRDPWRGFGTEGTQGRLGAEQDHRRFPNGNPAPPRDQKIAAIRYANDSSATTTPAAGQEFTCRRMAF